MHPRLKPSCLLVIWLASSMVLSESQHPPNAVAPALANLPTSAVNLCSSANHYTESERISAEQSEQSEQSELKFQAEGAVNIEAQQVDYQPGTQIKLKGNIEIVRGAYRAKSEQATINQVSEQAELMGGVEVVGPDLILKGDAATMDMINERMSVSNANFLQPSNRTNGQAKEIRRPNAETLIILDGEFTTCEPEHKEWSFAASEIKLDQASGFGTATHTRFNILDVPVLYIPWFSFPIDQQRKTGLLYPSIGSSNAGQGIFFSTPYYFNLGPQNDATLTPSYIHGRGLHTELEGRHLNSFTHTTLGAGYIEDDKHFAEEEAMLGRSTSGKRWGFNLEQDISLETLAPGWHGLIDYSAVSDNDYLEDLNQGLQIDNQERLNRRAEMFLSQKDLQFSVIVQQYKNLSDSVLARDEAYQRLPEMSLQVHQGFESLQLDWQSRYVYFYRDDQFLTAEEQSFGSRFRHQAKLSLPMQNHWGFLKPSITIDHTDYLLRRYSPEENHLSRTVPIYELDTGVFFDRSTSFFDSNLKQSLEPRMQYVYAPAKEQNAIPDFDSAIPGFHYQRLYNTNRFTGGDRIGDSNRLTLGLTSRWSDAKTGLDRAVISVGQIHHFDQQTVGLDGLGESDESESLFASELLIKPFTSIDIAASGLWNSNDNTTREGNSRISFHSPNYQKIVNFSHRYIRSELEQLDSSFIFPVNDVVSLLARWRYDLQDNRSIGSLAGVEYNSCCWRIQFVSQSYLTSTSEISNGILFRFQLKGIGGFGADTDSMDQQISGYAAREEYFN